MSHRHHYNGKPDRIVVSLLGQPLVTWLMDRQTCACGYSRLSEPQTNDDAGAHPGAVPTR